MRSARSVALPFVVAIGVVLTGCGANEDDEQFLAMVDEVMGANAEVEFPDDDLIAAGRAVCDSISADVGPSLSEATANVEQALGTDEFTAYLLALSAAQVYCPQEVPSELLYPSDG